MSRRRTVLALAAAPVVAAAATITAVLATGAHRRIGATEADINASRPGDALVPGADVRADRAINIDAPPSEVWPWIAQLGQNKAGFYSFEMLENMVGCEIQNAERIHPEWQDVQPGDEFSLAPGMSIRVADVEQGAHLVLTTEGGQIPPEAEGQMNFNFSWGFYLLPLAEADGTVRTRLHIRELYEPLDSKTERIVAMANVASAIMSWRMMRRLKSLAESAA